MRTTFEVRSKLETAAHASGRSLVQEVEHRVTRSLLEDDAFGGAELRPIAYLMASSFTLSGQWSAGPDVPPKEWLRSPARLTAITSVVDALIEALGVSDDEARLIIESIRGRVATRIANREASR
jgi:hypothetical protein